jgi:acetoin utilization deacetylase AcuC-like enzyme
MLFFICSDPLGGMSVTALGFAKLTSMVMDMCGMQIHDAIARVVCNCCPAKFCWCLTCVVCCCVDKVVLLLEGGYEPNVVSEASAYFWLLLSGVVSIC